MARIDTLAHFLTDVADAIRTKKGTQETILAEDFDTEIANIPSGGGSKYAPRRISFLYYDGTELDNEIENLDTSNITNMQGMFSGCSNIEELDLSSLDTSSATDMSELFNQCSALTDITFGNNFDTSNVTEMGSMFTGCSSLTSIDVSSFNTSSLENTPYMFSECPSLTSINVSNFDLSNGIDLGGMFAYCPDLASITFGNNTFSGTYFADMFAGDSSLTTLNLSNFNTSNAIYMARMFENCSNLETITFGNNFTFASLTTEEYQDAEGMFNGCTSLDDNTLNAILNICTTVGQDYTADKTLAHLGIIDTDGTLTPRIEALSNYTAFTTAGWTIS